LPNRLHHLTRLYSILETLQAKLGGARMLRDCSGRLSWPRRGVYFFREDGELRSDSGQGPRIVRVGTHALKAGSRSTLRGRLSQHRGQDASGGGNHRGSIFRLIVGAALMESRGIECPSWGSGSSAPRDVRAGEHALEREVSKVLGNMSVLWLAIEDEPGPASLRGLVERNAIALLSNYERELLDPPSKGWLGHRCDRERVRGSGLWNSNHVDDAYDPAFLDQLDALVSMAGTAP